MALPLLGKREINHDSTVYDFGLPDGTSLNLPVCACILLKAPNLGADGADAVRPYTPISGDALLGKFELLVKRYDGGVASQYLHGLSPGDLVEFKHIKFNIKTQYPFAGKKTFTLLAAGTGITPMYQALRKLLETPGDDRPVTLIYGSKSPDEILLKAELDEWASRHPQLKVVHVVGTDSTSPPPAGWVSTDTYTAETGWVDADKVAKYASPPADDTLVFVCGLPQMYDSLCGPRNESDLKEGSVLHALGYSSASVSKL